MGVAVYPFELVPRVARAELAFANAVARWVAMRPRAKTVEALVGGTATVTVTSVGAGDPYAAVCCVRVHGIDVEVRGASAFVRVFAQRVLGGPAELAAPRKLTEAEQAMWTLLVAAAIEDLGIEGEVWAVEEAAPVRVRSIALLATFAGVPCTIELRVPAALHVAAPRARPTPAWAERVAVVAPIVVGRCALARADLARLRVRSVVTLDRAVGTAELVLLGGAIGLVADPADPVVVRVATEYVPRPMAPPDAAQVELTVGLGTAKLSLRQVMGLAVGEVVPMGRPLAGPFEIRAEGKLIGQGELVDVDGELGVRIVSFAEE